MGLYACCNIALVAIGICLPGWTGQDAILLSRFFMSLMYPTIFVLGLHDLGPNTKAGASLLVMAIIDGAVFTTLIALVFEATRSMAVAMVVPLGCYVMVAAYAFWGSEMHPRKAVVATQS